MPFDKNTLSITINAPVVSKLFCCCNVWNNTSENNLNRIQGVQNFAASIITNTRKYDHVSPVTTVVLFRRTVSELYLVSDLEKMTARKLFKMAAVLDQTQIR